MLLLLLPAGVADVKGDQLAVELLEAVAGVGAGTEGCVGSGGTPRRLSKLDSVPCVCSVQIQHKTDQKKQQLHSMQGS